MTFVEAATQLEGQDRPLAAAWAYECALCTESRHHSWLLNAAVLYFVCLDPGFADAHSLPAEFVTAAGQRFRTFLNAAAAEGGDDAEIAFWRGYFDFVHLGEPPIDALATELAENSISARVYLAAYSASTPGETARRLASELPSENTARTRYLQSLIAKR
jgi:hypothetical protein